MNKDNLLIWSSSFYPVVGGLQSATYEIAQLLINQDWNVQVLTNKYPRELQTKEILNQIKVNRYILLSNPIEYLKSGRLDLLMAYFIFKPITFIQLIIFFIVNKPKIVNLHFPGHQLVECIILKKIFKFKLIVSLHGNEVERIEQLKKTSFKYKLYNQLFHSASYISGCSQYLINQVQNHFSGINNGKYFVFYNGVNKKFTKIKLIISKKNYLFMASRFIPKKGIGLLVNGYEYKNEMKLYIAGGNDKDLEVLGIKKKIGLKLLGSISKPEMLDYLTESYITIVPSLKEPFGIIVAEAICCGSPLVATNVGGIPEVIALATEKLNEQEKQIFNSWVKLVKPLTESIFEGIESIKNNNLRIEDYIKLIPKIRDQFRWGIRANDYLIKVNLL